MSFKLGDESFWLKKNTLYLGMNHFGKQIIHVHY
jgi:hypothetical protein